MKIIYQTLRYQFILRLNTYAQMLLHTLWCCTDIKTINELAYREWSRSLQFILRVHTLIRCSCTICDFRVTTSLNTTTDPTVHINIKHNDWYHASYMISLQMLLHTLWFLIMRSVTYVIKIIYQLRPHSSYKQWTQRLISCQLYDLSSDALWCQSDMKITSQPASRVWSWQ